MHPAIGLACLDAMKGNMNIMKIISRWAVECGRHGLQAAVLNDPKLQYHPFSLVAVLNSKNYNEL